MLGMTRCETVILILSLNPDRNYTVVDSARGSEKMLPNNNRRERDCTENAGFSDTVFDMDLWGRLSDSRRT